MKAECLPPEIWLEIFSYLTPKQNIQAFSNLNRFFDRLTSTNYFLINHIVNPTECLPISSKLFTQGPCPEIIRSLSSNHQTPHCLIKFLLQYSDRLIHLQNLSIYLNKRTVRQLDFHVIDILKQLPSLTRLDVESHAPNTDHWQMRSLLALIFSDELVITHCRLCWTNAHSNFTEVRWSGTSSIRFLTLETVSWSNLLLVLNQTPNLYTLKVSIDQIEFKPATIIIRSLRKVILTIKRTQFAVLEEFRRLAPNLEFFSVRGSFWTNDEDFFREDSWRKLLVSIPFYDISLKSWVLTENEVDRLHRKRASPVKNRLVFSQTGRRFLCATIVFRSK